MVLLVCHASSDIGLGHLSRILALAHSLLAIGLNPELLIFGNPPQRADLDELPHRAVPLTAPMADEIDLIANSGAMRAIVFDLHAAHIPADFSLLLDRLTQLGIRRIGVDNLRLYSSRLDLVWIPSCFLAHPPADGSERNLHYGWDSYLIRRRCTPQPWQAGHRVLILTGGSDVAGLGQTLPSQADENLPSDAEVHWVQGPFAPDPHLPEHPRLVWTIHRSPAGLDELLMGSDYVLTVFGVSLFESLQYGLPTTVFSPYGDKDSAELAALKREKVCAVANNPLSAVKALSHLMLNVDTAENLSEVARNRLARNGADQLASRIQQLLGAHSPNPFSDPSR